MGVENKLLLPVKGRAMITWGIDALTKTNVSEIIVVLGYEAGRIEEVLSGYSALFVLNPDYAEGMATSISKGVKAASRDAAGYMVCLSDLPFIKDNVYKSLMAAFNDAYSKDTSAIVRPVFEGRQGHPVIFANTYRTQLMQCAGDEGARQVVQANSAHVRLHEVQTGSILQDLDTPETYRQALSDKDMLNKDIE